MAKRPALVLGLNRDTPLERVVQLFDRHFTFVTPVGAEIAGGLCLGIFPKPHSPLLEGEIEIADGKLSTLRRPSRLNSWADSKDNPCPHFTLMCTHSVRLGPDGEKADVFRYRGDEGRWSRVTQALISRGPGGFSIHVMLSHPTWYPLWDCPPLRIHDEDHWREMLSSLRNAVTDAGQDAEYVTVDLGHYLFHKPLKAFLMKEAESIPLVQIE